MQMKDLLNMDKHAQIVLFSKVRLISAARRLTLNNKTGLAN